MVLWGDYINEVNLTLKNGFYGIREFPKDSGMVKLSFEHPFPAFWDVLGLAEAFGSVVWFLNRAIDLSPFPFPSEKVPALINDRAIWLWVFLYCIMDFLRTWGDSQEIIR